MPKFLIKHITLTYAKAPYNADEKWTYYMSHSTIGWFIYTGGLRYWVK